MPNETNQGTWVPDVYSDRERAESLIKAAIEKGNGENIVPDAVDAALEFAAQQWDRLGRYMRKNATEQADLPQVAVTLQSIAIAATDRANQLRRFIRLRASTEPPSPAAAEIQR